MCFCTHSISAHATTAAAPVQKHLARAYGRVDRTALRDYLLTRCKKNGVTYVRGIATSIDAPRDAEHCSVHAGDHIVCARVVTLAGGAASAKFLKFEDDAPPVAAQTAYGITAIVEGYSEAYNPETMLFMDYRRMHSGLWDGTGPVLSSGVHAHRREVWHPNWAANHGSCHEAPSFLYAMPLGGGEVFLEETCLVARPTLPFADLKRRLLRRCAAMGVAIKEVSFLLWSVLALVNCRRRPVFCKRRC